MFFLKPQRLIEDGVNPVLEFAVVVIGDNKVSNAIEATFSELGSVKGEACNPGISEAFNKVLLDTSSGGDNGIDHFVLDEVTNGFAHAR